jgi:hypothetical protein
MTVYKAGKVYRFDFMCNGGRYTQSGFSTKRDAATAEAITRKKVLVATQPKPQKDRFFLGREDEIMAVHGVEKYNALKTKYGEFLEDPYNCLPDLVDMIFGDFDLPYRYADLKKIALKRKTRKNIPAKLRLAVLKRDGNTCTLCGSSPPGVVLHVDHIVPYSRGGMTEKRNLRTLCASCNLGKNDMPYSVAG